MLARFVASAFFFGGGGARTGAATAVLAQRGGHGLRAFATDDGGKDFLSRHREEAEAKLEDLTEEGWEKKIPTSKDDAKKATPSEDPPAEKDEAPAAPEVDGPRGPEPTRYGDWERAGRCSDF